MVNVKIPVFECLRCGHRWCAKKQERPVCCGFCKNPRWDVAGEPSNAQDRHRKDCKGPQCGSEQ
jgi:hypothetical protein